VTAEPLINDVTDLSPDELKDNFIGIQAGIGFDLWFITLDARIESSFNIFMDSSHYTAANRLFLLSAGVKLL
jgi:hypothetical protein